MLIAADSTGGVNSLCNKSNSALCSGRTKCVSLIVLDLGVFGHEELLHPRGWRHRRSEPELGPRGPERDGASPEGGKAQGGAWTEPNAEERRRPAIGHAEHVGERQPDRVADQRADCGLTLKTCAPQEACGRT